MISWWSPPPGLAGGCCRFVAVSKWQCSQKHPTFKTWLKLLQRICFHILKENRLCLLFLAFALLTVSLPLHSKLESACRQTGILGNYENHARGKDSRLTIKSHYPTISYFKKRKVHGGNIEHYWFPKEMWLEARLQKILEFGFSDLLRNQTRT